MVGFIVAVLTVAPFLYYRYAYTHSKRLREVVPGVLYRAGTLTIAGFEEALADLNIRTVVNLQCDCPDPVLTDFLGLTHEKQQDICERMKVNYVWIAPDLISRRKVGPERPTAIDKFLEVMDDPKSYPVLIHCRAGLHRTGVMTAVYRMEYQGWSNHRALREVKNNGFGDSACTSANDYIVQYVLAYRPGLRREGAGFKPAPTAAAQPR